uniref:CSON012343 protein n=1 Tax=Culicoides sonorensis TaxID=179676 RepID=A0A336M578_CULSO
MGICTKLPTVSSCCCGCTLKTGTLILAWIYLIGSILSISTFGVAINQLDKSSSEYNNELTTYIIGLVVYSIQLLLSFLLLYGSYKEKANLLLPYLWLQGFNLILVLIAVIIGFVTAPLAAIAPLLGWCNARIILLYGGQFILSTVKIRGLNWNQLKIIDQKSFSELHMKN